MNLDWQTWPNVASTVVAIMGSILIGLAVHQILYAMGRRLAGRHGETEHLLLATVGRPALTVLPLLILLAVMPRCRFRRVPKLLLTTSSSSA